MTGEDIERTIAFILEQQAQASASNAQTQSTLARLTERTDRNAEGITALLAIAEMHEREIIEHREAQARADAEHREAQSRADAEHREAQSRTDERLNALINTVERYISEGRNGKA